MDIGLLPKLRFARAAEAVAGLKLPPEALALLAPGATPAAYLKALLDAGMWADAVRLLAAALPAREAVWWACLVARQVLPAPPPAAEVAAIEAAEAWVFQPTEQSRRATYAVADALECSTPAACAALAAYWSGGSVAPPDAPVVIPPQEGLSGTMAAASILLAVAVKPEKAGACFRSAIERAVDIAKGGSGRLGQDAPAPDTDGRA